MRTRSFTRTRTTGIALLALVALAAAALAGCTASSEMNGGEPAATFDMAVEEDAYYGEDEGFADTEMLASEAPRAAGAGTDASTIPEDDRLIIRDKSLRMEVEDVRDTVDEIRDLADANDAIVTNVNVSTEQGPIYRYDEYGSTVGSGEALSGWITLRVPATSYDTFVDAVSDLGDILWEGESTDDVTQQHVDLSARLANLEAEEARLREFFDAANNVEEMLNIERELARVRGEIEAMTAQIAYLERQAAMATVTIELSEPADIVRPDGPDWGFERAVTAGLQLAANVVKALIVVLLGAAPLLAIAAVLFLVIRAIVRSRRKAAEKTAAEMQAAYEGDHTEGA